MRGDVPEALMWDIIKNEARYTPKQGDRVLDLGAHLGYFSLYCAARGAVVDAYEPQSEVFSAAFDMITKEPCGRLVKLYNRAVWWAAGKFPMWKNLENTGASSMVAQVGEKFEVDAILLEEAMDNHTWDCVKVDIEGAEAEVFNVPSRLLNQIKYLTMELHPNILSETQETGLYIRMRESFSIVTVVKQDQRIYKMFCER